MLPMTGSAYGYASGDPVNNTDPLGLFTIPGTGICVAIADPSCDNSANAAWAGNVYAGIGNALTFGQGVNLAARARGYGGGFTADCADTGSGAYVGGEIGGTVLQSVFFGVMPKATAGKNEQSGAFYLFENWHKGTFANRTQSIAYHMGKHGNGRSASAI